MRREIHIKEIAGILKKYANPEIIKNEIEIAWEKFAKEWKKKQKHFK